MEESERSLTLFRHLLDQLAEARRDITDEVMAAIRDLSGQEEADEFNELSGSA